MQWSSKTKILYLTALVFILLLAALAVKVSQNRQEVLNQPPTTTEPETELEETTEPETTTPEPTSPSEQPAPAEPTETVTLPAEASKLLTNFYQAYKDQDSEKLLDTYMTKPVSDSEKEIQSLMWKGKDLKGTPGGPTLFVSSIASAVVTSHTIVSTGKSGDYWIVKTKETVTIENQTEQRERILELTSSSPYLVNRYLAGSATGKYSGFLN